MAAAGSVSPRWDRQAGELSLVGSLDRLELTCTVGQGELVALEGCYAEVLEAADVRARIDAHLRPGARGLPKLALRELLTERLGLELDDLRFARPHPGVLRLSAFAS